MGSIMSKIFHSSSTLQPLSLVLRVNDFSRISVCNDVKGTLNCRCFAIGFGTGLALWAITSLTGKLMKTKAKELETGKIKDTTTEIYDCLLYTIYQPMQCFLPHVIGTCYFSNCSLCNNNKLIGMLKDTIHRLDICVYLITNREICDVLVLLARRGVKVRIITDNQMSMEGKNSKVPFFLKLNIPVKLIKSGGLMHNKFVIIDRKTLITGSFNWTMQGVRSNFENAVIIKDIYVVEKFNTYFDDIWINCKD